MKELVFGKGLMVPFLDGEKRFTVRKFREEAHKFVKNEIIIGKFKEGLNILLQITDDSKIAPFNELLSCQEKSAKVGYYFDEARFEYLKSYYPDLTWENMGAVIFFEVLKVNGISVVAFNEFTERYEE